ncbi:MAG: ABC transporter substrate-binding protein [Gemmatimonadales bacterium]|nr:MAG: ABC transporter substrate-binding protein [Gemmatimonadales bacterium]
MERSRPRADGRGLQHPRGRLRALPGNNPEPPGRPPSGRLAVCMPATSSKLPVPGAGCHVRTPYRSPRTFPLALMLALVGSVGAGCTLVGTTPGEPPAPPAAPGPAITDGVSDAASDRAVAELLADGESRLSRGDASGALSIAREIATRFPTAQGSSSAYWLEARAEAAGEAWDAAETAAARYIGVVGMDAFDGAAAQVLRARVRFRGGMGDAVEALFSVPDQAPESVREDARAVGREIAGSFDDRTLRALLDEAPSQPWLLPVFLVELGERRLIVGDVTGGTALARRALDMQPGATERARAEGIISGEVARSGARVAGVLSAVLSEGGSPGMEQLSRLIRDGIEVALLDEEYRGGVRLAVSDDRGTPTRSGEVMRAAEGGAPLGIVGPLTEAGLAEAARVRGSRVPVISPTSRLVPEGVEGVYSIAAVDPEAFRVLADMIWRDGSRQVVVLHSRSQEEQAELRWFREAFEARGGEVLRTFSYASGATTFAEPLQAIASMRPRALLILVPPEDLELVAPQLDYYGVTQGSDVRIYGNAAWTLEGVLEGVPTRYTDGVRTVSSHVGDGFGPEWRRFVNAYESHFQRTLRNPAPGLGWDAARLLLHAASIAGNSPEEVARGITQIRDFPGATGTFSYRNGWLGRSYTPVRIENRALLPLDEDR